MARLTRKNIKVFAGNATNNGVFGSLQANNPVTTNDVEQIQSLTAWGEGWDAATETSEDLPPLEEMQGVEYVTTYQQAYIMQEGIPEWAAKVTYYKGCLAKEVTSTGFRIYCSLTDDNIGNIISDTANWKKVMDSEDLYAFDNAVVHKAGAETITGPKTFQGTGWITYIKNTNVTYNTAPSSDTTTTIAFVDKNSQNMGVVECVRATDNATLMQFNLQGANGSWSAQPLQFRVDANGNSYAYAPTPTDTTSTSSHQIVTVGWLNSGNNNVVHRTGNQTIAGTKTFSSTIAGSINGNAATVTNGVYTTGNQTIGGTKTFSAVAYGKASDATDSILTTVAKTKAENGYFKLGNGLIIQWGRFTNTNNTFTVTLPTPFTTNNYSIAYGCLDSQRSGDNTITTNTTSTTKFTGWISCHSTSLQSQWVAIGY